MIEENSITITLKDITAGEYITLPQTPPTLSYKEGDQQADTVKIVNLGDVDFLNGTALEEITIECTFPARYDPSYCTGSKIDRPVIYRNFILYLRNHKLPVQLICPNAYLNRTMYVSSFTWTATGFEGDIDYSLTLKEYRTIKPIQIDVTTAVDGSIVVVQDNPPASRPPAPAPAPPPTYTVVDGDTLSLIGKKLGQDWHDIYAKNKGVIGTNPNQIYPGQVYTL